MSETKQVFMVEGRRIVPALQIFESTKDDDKTIRGVLDFFYEDTGEFVESKIFEIADCYQPLDKWHGNDDSERVMSYLEYQSEARSWITEMILSDEKRLIPFLAGRLKSIWEPATKLIATPDTKDLGIEALRRVFYNSKRLFSWPTRKRKGKTGRKPVGFPHALVVIDDVLLRKHTKMRKRARYNIIRRNLKKLGFYYRDDSPIDKIISRNKHLTTIIDAGRSAWNRKREDAIRDEVDTMIGIILMGLSKQ